MWNAPLSAQQRVHKLISKHLIDFYHSIIQMTLAHSMFYTE